MHLHHKTFQVRFYIGNRYHCGNISVIFNIFWEQKYWWQVWLNCGNVSLWDIMYLWTGGANVRSEVLLDLPQTILCSVVSAQSLVPMVTAMLLRTVTGELTEPQCYEPTKNFIINFMFLNAWKLLKLCSSILTFFSHYLVLQNVFFFFFFLLEGTFSLEKMKWKSKWPTVLNMCFQKLWKMRFYITKTF